MMLQFIR